MEAYAVIETGGKQYRVQSGDVLSVERLGVEVGQDVHFERVLAISDGTALRVGTPEIADAKVLAKVVEHLRAPKVISFKKKRRKGYMRKVGHRQELTVLKVDSIG